MLLYKCVRIVVEGFIQNVYICLLESNYQYCAK